MPGLLLPMSTLKRSGVVKKGGKKLNASPKLAPFCNKRLSVISALALISDNTVMHMLQHRKYVHN